MIYHLTAFCIGFFVDLWLGDPLGSFHIVVWIGKGISLLERAFPEKGEHAGV